MPDAKPGRARRWRAVPDVPPLGTTPPLATPTGRAPDVSPARANVVLVLLSVAAFAFVTSEVLPVGLITLISADLHRTNSEVGLLVTAYAGVVVATSIPLAHFTRRIPRRQLLSATLLVYVAGMLLASLGGGFTGLLVGRMLTGFAQAQFWGSSLRRPPGSSPRACAARSSRASSSAPRSLAFSACLPRPGSASTSGGARPSTPSHASAWFSRSSSPSWSRGTSQQMARRPGVSPRACDASSSSSPSP